MRRTWLAAGVTAALALGVTGKTATAVSPEALETHTAPTERMDDSAPGAATSLQPARNANRKELSLVKELNPGARGTSFLGWIELDGCVFFTAFDGDRIRLYKINPQGEVKKIAALGQNFAGGYSDPYFAVFQGELYFAAGRPGKEAVHLYKRSKDGVISLVADVGGDLGTFPQYMTVFQNALYFVGVNASGARGLYRINSAGAVELVHAVEPIWSGNIFVEHRGELYFAGLDPDAGIELFKVKNDGTVVRAADINPSGDSWPFELTSWNGELYFNAFRPNVGFELFKLDRTGKAMLVADINPGPGPEGNGYPKGSSEPGYLGGFVPFNGELYFKADAGDPIGPELHKIDRNGNVVLVADINKTGETDPSRTRANDGPNRYLKHQGELYFTTYGGAAVGRELYKIKQDGSVVLVADIDSSDEYGSDPRNLTLYQGQLYFSAYRIDVGGFELFRLALDGSVKLAKDINPTPDFGLLVPQALVFGSPAKTVRPQFAVFRGDLYFGAVADPNVGVELYKYGVVDK